MEATGVLGQRAFPSDRRGQKQRVETGVVKPLTVVSARGEVERAAEPADMAAFVAGVSAESAE